MRHPEGASFECEIGTERYIAEGSGAYFVIVDKE